VLHEEERRLFNVALTHAKEELFLFTGKGNESSFIDEIPGKFSVTHSEALNPIISEIPVYPGSKYLLNTEFQFCPWCRAKIKIK